jgi:outer membrane protein assembly factor BamD (BamD/ComL family)
MEDNANAIARFNILVKKFPESNVARRAANEIGLLYYQDDKYPEAIQAYKQVIAGYPGSEEARLAQRDLKSIYIDLNKVDEYANFAKTFKSSIAPSVLPASK